METKKCVGPLHKGQEIDATLFGANQKCCRECKHEYHRKRYTAKADSILSYGRAWKKANKERVDVYNKDWRDAHPDRVKAWQDRYNKKAENRIAKNTIKRIHAAFGFRVLRKDLPDYLGCDIPEYMKYLESLFTPGMSWKNYGAGRRAWELDHYFALSLHDKSDPTAIKTALYYKNTRPLWSRDNKVKGFKVPQPPVVDLSWAA